MTRLFLLALTPFIAACEPVEREKSGRDLYLDDCAACHGPQGKGDGPLVASLDAPVPDLTTIAARYGGFPRDQVMSTIDGLDRGTHFSGAMPEFGAGDMGDTIIVERDGLGTPIPTGLLAITDYLESIQS